MPVRAQQQTVLDSDAVAAAQAESWQVPTSGDAPRRRGASSPHEERPSRPTEDPKSRKRRPIRRFFKRFALFAGLATLLVGGWLGFRFYQDIARLTGDKNPLSLFKVFVPVELRNDEGRVNILLAANSADDKGHNGANLTDSIMVLSVDTKKNTAMMLSIPRDLWVNIPGYGHSKINAAYPEGGMDLLQEVVQDTLDVPIHYNALVNYGAFRDMVDAVGGITITIDSSDSRGIYDPSLDWTSRTCCALAKYPNGPVTLDGHQALNLARARGDARGSYGYAQSDFTRTMYQRKMMLAVKDKATQTSVIANPFKVADLVDAVGSNVKTDLELNEVQTLYTVMKKVDDSKIDSYNLNTLKGKNSTMLASYTTPDGQSALIPAAGIDDYSAIQAQLEKVLTSDPVSKEGAITVVLNGTETSGLAATQQTFLTGKGMTVYIGDAPDVQDSTTVIDNSSGEMPNTLTYLTSQYKASVTTNTSLIKAYPSADFIVILGKSAVPAQSNTTASAR